DREHPVGGAPLRAAAVALAPSPLVERPELDHVGVPQAPAGEAPDQVLRQLAGRVRVRGAVVVAGFSVDMGTPLAAMEPEPLRMSLEDAEPAVTIEIAGSRGRRGVGVPG